MVLTHRHADHTDGLRLVPSTAEVFVGSGDWPTHAGALACRWPAGRTPTLVDAQRALTSDGALRIVPLKGHSPGHLGVELGNAYGAVLFAGDAVFDLAQLRARRIAGISEVPGDALRSLDLSAVMPRSHSFAMTSSGYVWNDIFAHKMARPHDKDGRPMENKRSTPADVARYASAGALLTTPTDYARFLLEIIAPTGPDQFRLKPSTVAEMVRPQVELHDKSNTAWGLGFAIYRTKNGELIGHGGDNHGFHCLSLMAPARRAGIVVMTNSEGGALLLNRLVTDNVLAPFL